MARESLIIKLLEDKMGFTRNQALVYFELIKVGAKGTIVRELDHALDINRTNIYPVLNDLIEMGCVKEGGRAEKSKNATIFIAVDPLNFLDKFIKQKQNEINKLIEIKNTHSKSLQIIFKKGFTITLDEIEPELAPYIRPLLKVGWEIQSYVVREELAMFNYKVHDCMLYTPKARFLKDCSFHLFLFDYNIEKDKEALKFFSKGLKRKTKEMKSYFFDIKQFQLIDDVFEISGKQLNCFKMRIKIDDLKNSNYFSEIMGEFEKDEKRDGYYEIGKAIILPIREKIFYLWAETEKFLNQMLKPILSIEIL
ncbi:MAG: hypothetical protein EU539_12770 [Promethearchaeota archaeon]|nr:MAG: hypothetical protein EU539_12770 [Candidatus Lokiarchaeota archaeon]